MTVIYVPRLIESAEQAEALPIGTMARTYSVAHDIEGCVKDWDNAWLGTHGPGAFTDLGMVGFTALVPIEAEEEWEDDGRPVWNLGEGEATPADVDDYERRNGRRPSRRLVTPWEEA